MRTKFLISDNADPILINDDRLIVMPVLLKFAFVYINRPPFTYSVNAALNSSFITESDGINSNSI